MSLHYCWPTRALNNFCVTQSINLPSLCGWKHCQRGAPAPKVNSGLAAASVRQTPQQWGWRGAHSGKSQNTPGLAEAEGVRALSSPYRVASYDVMPVQLKPGEPACLGWGEDASKWREAGRLEGIPSPYTSLHTPRRLAHFFLLQW